MRKKGEKKASSQLHGGGREGAGGVAGSQGNRTTDDAELKG